MEDLKLQLSYSTIQPLMFLKYAQVTKSNLLWRNNFYLRSCKQASADITSKKHENCPIKIYTIWSLTTVFLSVWVDMCLI